MGGNHKVTDGLIAVFCSHITNGKEISQGLRHFAVVDIYITVVHPIAGKFTAVCTFRLGNFIFVVGEDKILTAAVYINGLAEIFPRHGRTLYVPSGTSFAPGRLPEGLAFLGRFPEGKVHGTLLLFGGCSPLAGPLLKLVKRLMGQFSVLRELLGTEINISSRRIGIALFHKRGNNFNYFVNIFGCSGMYRSLPDIKTLGVSPKLLNIPLGNLPDGYALLICLVNKLVVNIGKILDKIYLHSPPLKISSEHVENAEGTGISYMNIVVNRGSAGIYLCLSRRYGNKLLFFPGQGVENFHKIPSSLYFHEQIFKLCRIIYDIVGSLFQFALFGESVGNTHRNNPVGLSRLNVENAVSNHGRGCFIHTKIPHNL